MKKRITFLLACLGMCVCLLCSCQPMQDPAVEETPVQTVQLSFQISSRVDDVLLEQAELFMERVQELSEGTIRMELITAAPGSDALKQGEWDIALLYNIQMAQADSLFSMFGLPFIYDDWNHMSRALNCQQILEILQERLANKNIKPLAAIYNGNTSLVALEKDIRDVGDFKDRVLAVRADSEEKIKAFQALGAQVEPYPSLSIVEMLNSGIVDAAEVSIDQTAGILAAPQDIHYINSQHTIKPLWLVVNAQTFEKLDSVQQAAIYEGIAGFLAQVDDARAQHESQLMLELQDQGIAIVDIEREELGTALYNSSAGAYTAPDYFDLRIYNIIQEYAL